MNSCLRVRRVVLIGLSVAAAGLLVLLCAGVWANVAIRGGSIRLIHERPEDVPARPVAIVFGAKVWATGPSHILEDRLDAGIALYKSGKVRKLLLSGDHGQREYDEVNAMRDYVLARGVKPADVFLDHAGFRTYDTLYRARDVFGVKSAVLVTNRFHLPRSIYVARRLGLDVVGLSSDARAYRTWLYNNCREFLARTLAWVEVNVTCPSPKYLGPAIDIEGDGRVTHDRH